MGTETVRAFFKLIRFEYSLFSAFGVLLSGLLGEDLQGFQLEYVIAFFIVFLAAVGAYAFNDYFDFKLDKNNKRYDRPLVLGLLPRKIALVTSIVSFFLTFLLILILNPPAMLLVLGSLPLFFFYSAGLKKVFLVKNILIAYAYVGTILFGSLVSDAVLEPLIIYFAAMGFIIGLALEIMLDIGDVSGDRVLGIETLATKLGRNIAAKVSIFLYGVIMILDPLPFFVTIDSHLYRDWLFLVLVLIPVISYGFISKSLWKDLSQNNVFRLKQRIVVTMQVGSIAYLVGVLL